MGTGKQKRKAPTVAKTAKVDTTRASRDGHEFHETWVARRALQLLWPDSVLSAIAVEGLSPAETAKFSRSTEEIADVVLYYGTGFSFADAERTVVAQFKYSVSKANEAFRASDAKKTLTKFAGVFREHRRQHGAKTVGEKLEFHYVTNRPVFAELERARASIAEGAPSSDDDQTKQFTSATGLTGTALRDFAQKCSFLGSQSDLPTSKRSLESLLVDWSSGTDLLAAARLGRLRSLARDKAGTKGQHDNLITRPDVLTALQVHDPAEFLPCPTALTEVGSIVEREQLAEAESVVLNSQRSLLIHAPGGAGKTVFLESLAAKLSQTELVVFFDCFGGGAYRSPHDARHLPRRGFVHIGNSLAFRGLCEPLLPGTPDEVMALSAFRARLEQSIVTLRRVTPDRTLLIVLDAIDNAEIAAKRWQERPFPHLLMESLHDAPIAGLKLVVSCRSERRPDTYAKYDDFELQPFTPSETKRFVRARDPSATTVDVDIAHSKSGGNPRVLDYLLRTQGLGESPSSGCIALDDLIEARIESAIDAAKLRGWEEAQLKVFLGALVSLPPPVPIEEHAGASGVNDSAVESFASDLSPLLERTSQGLLFRDEPTETYVIEHYGSSESVLREVAKNLAARQEESVYAAESLPGILYELGDGEQLFALAFDPRLPHSVRSTVGRRNIRRARLRAAARYAAVAKDFSRLSDLLLELSTLEEVTQRGARYISQSPDLVACSQDADVIRRLHETGREWPGSRHARRAILATLLGHTEEASRSFAEAREWTVHYRRTDQSVPASGGRPEHPDLAAAPLYLLSRGRPKVAARLLASWLDWYAFELTQHTMRLVGVAQQLQPTAAASIAPLIDGATQLGPLAAFLAFSAPNAIDQERLVAVLAKRCRGATKLKLDEGFERDRTPRLADGLRKAAAIALKVGRSADARAISLRAPGSRVDLWAFNRTYDHYPIFAFIFRQAVVAAGRGTAVHERDVLPIEVHEACKRIPMTEVGADFRTAAKSAIAKAIGKKRPSKEEATRNRLTHEDQYRAGQFIDHLLEPLRLQTQGLSDVLRASHLEVDQMFVELLERWIEARRNDRPGWEDERSNFFWTLGFRVALFALWAREDLSADSARRFTEAVDSSRTSAHDLVQAVAAISNRPLLRPVTSELAAVAKDRIELEHDVDHRASLLSELARSLLPTSAEDSNAYFRLGLEQMDAIGSGDYWYTAGLLRFAGVAPGAQLGEEEFHTLSNVCELNLGDEPHKFYWSAFAAAFARVADARILAKLSRWDDRSTVSLQCSLMPFLGALVRESKLAARTAVALNYLADPYEYRGAGTSEFVQQVATTTLSATEVGELIDQFEGTTPDLDIEGATKALEQLARDHPRVLGKTAERMRAVRECESANRDILNERSTHRGATPSMVKRRRERTGKRDPIEEVVKQTDPCDAAALSAAIKAFNGMSGRYAHKKRLMEDLRAKVPVNRRSAYLRAVAGLDNLYVHWKLGELVEARQAWIRVSPSLQQVCEELATAFVDQHLAEVLDDNGFSHSILNELSEFGGLRPVDIALLVTQRISQFDIAVNGADWLALAYYFAAESTPPHARDALSRLLGSEAASLASNTTDGGWRAELYPDAIPREIAAGTIWRSLGAVEAEDRWRAAHSMRACARLGCWEVLDQLVFRLADNDAGPFQANELPFFALHARLWCVMALARIALDYPTEVCRYHEQLLAVTRDADSNHVLIQYFAAKALLACAEQGVGALPREELARLRSIGSSAMAPIPYKPTQGFYDGRPDSAPKRSHQFHLDYEFHKHEVDGLARVFGKGCWEIADLVAEAAATIAPGLTGMSDAGGRANSRYGMTAQRHTYGEMVGWHALLFAASKLLAQSPTTIGQFRDDNPWHDWFRRFGLTRDDGYWISDATDRTPIDIRVFLLEQKKKGLVLTGGRDQLCALVGMPEDRREWVVEGSWYSADKVRVRLSSALAPTATADKLCRRLTRERPAVVWLPSYSKHGDGDEYLMDENDDFEAWIVTPSRESRLDEQDPFGSPTACQRPHLSAEVQKLLGLTPADRFLREWTDSHGTVSARTEAWGRRSERDDSEKSSEGERLLVDKALVQKLLTKKNKALVLLITLERTERLERSKYRWSRTVAVLRLDADGGTKYFKGRVNHLQESTY